MFCWLELLVWTYKEILIVQGTRPKLVYNPLRGIWGVFWEDRTLCGTPSVWSQCFCKRAFWGIAWAWTGVEEEEPWIPWEAFELHFGWGLVNVGAWYSHGPIILMTDCCKTVFESFPRRLVPKAMGQKYRGKQKAKGSSSPIVMSVLSIQQITTATTTTTAMATRSPPPTCQILTCWTLIMKILHVWTKLNIWTDSSTTFIVPPQIHS